jgi:hypothetical protein
MIDLIQREVKGYGWLPIVEKDGKEVYRGEFKKTPLEAINKCLDAVARLDDV